MPRVPHQSHEMNWVNAIKGTDTISCPFSYAAHLTEIMLLGVAAMRAGTRLQYDGAAHARHEPRPPTTSSSASIGRGLGCRRVFAHARTVIGGTQFMGRSIVDRLVARGHEVTVLHRSDHHDLGPACAQPAGRPG